MNLTITPRRLTTWLVGIVIALSLASAGMQVAKYVFGHDRLFGLVPLFNVLAERNVPTWFSSALLLLCAALLAVVAAGQRQRRERYALHWAGLAVVFVFLSIDETAAIHETVARALRKDYGASGLLYAAWIVPWGAFAVGLALAYRRFLRDLPASTRRAFLVTGLLYVGAAAGIEAVQGRELEQARTEGIVGRGEMTALGAALGSVEELVEMLALVFFARAVLSYCGMISNNVVRVRVADEEGEVRPAP